MVRVKKRASKRQTTKQREKVLKKVREHHRKQRREAKRNPQWKSRRREDPGIPNSYPFKEQLLNEIEQNRRIAAENRMGLHQNEEDEEEEEGEEEQQQQKEEEEQPAPGYEEPIHLPHAPVLHTPLEDVLSSSKDIKALVYVLDARDPSAFRSAWLEAQLTKKSPELVYVLAKADLVPAEVLTAWVYRLLQTKRAVFPVAVPPTMEAQGVDALAEYLAPKLSKGAAVVVGFQNVGKTAVATTLQGALQARGGDEQVFDAPMLLPMRASLPVDEEEEEEVEDDEDDEEHDGTTQSELARREKERLKLLWLLIRNQGNVQRFKDPQALVRTLLSRVAHHEDLMLIYGTPAFGSFVPEQATLSDDAPAEEVALERLQLAQEKAEADTDQFLISVARSVGRLKRHGVPDVVSAARTLLRDWSHASLGYYAKPLDRVKAVEASGSKDDKARWAKAQAAVAHLPAVLPRKQWREQWNKRELRLNALHEGPLAEEPLVFAPVSEEDEDEESEDVPVYGSEDDEGDAAELHERGDDEELDEDDEDLDEDDDQEDEEEDEEENDEEEAIPPPSKASRKRSAPAPAQPSKRAAASTKPSKRAASAPKRKESTPRAKRAPAPGEAYDLNAYF